MVGTTSCERSYYLDNLVRVSDHGSTCSVFSCIGACSWLQLTNVNKFCFLVCRRAGSSHISYAQLFEFLVFGKKKRRAVFTHLICHFLLLFRIIPSPMGIFMHLSSTQLAVLLHNCVPVNTISGTRWITVDSRCYLRERKLCRM